MADLLELDSVDTYYGRVQALSNVSMRIAEGEIALFDRAYVDFAHLHELSERGVFWVTRAKEHSKG